MKRETAYKVRIKDLFEGQYIVKEGWEPNYIENNGKKFARVNVIGTVIEGEQNNFVLDDGTAQITLRSFDQAFADVVVGKTYLVIGRPREYNEQRMIIPEIMKELPNQKWIEVRQAELQDLTTPEEVAVEVEQSESKDELIIKKIKDLDEGEGVSSERLQKQVGECEKAINRLLQEGEIFEIRPGVLKIL